MTRRDHFHRTEGPMVTNTRGERRGMSLLLAIMVPAVALVGFYAQVAGGEQDSAGAETAEAPTVTAGDDTLLPREIRTVVFVGATGAVVGGAGWLAFRMSGSHQRHLEELEAV
ncbi:MAG: hypothetical protein GY745_15655 [Actinomycetia bacterium]|nr:hypothetical protein [Actinomycetes bacterium]